VGQSVLYKSCLIGLLFPALMALPCVFTLGKLCLDIPDTNGIDLAGAYAFWLAYELLGFLVPWALDGWAGAGLTLLLALGFLVPAVLISAFST
jgi:hypothetical protein